MRFAMEDTWPFKQVQGAEGARGQPLRMDVTTEAGVLFAKDEVRQGKALLLDLTVTNPCAPSRIGRELQQAGRTIADATETKHQKYRGTFPATYTLVPLVVSTTGALGPDLHALLREMAGRLADRADAVGSAATTPQVHKLVVGREMARLRRRFSFCLQRALSQRTRYVLSRHKAFCHPATPPVAGTSSRSERADLSAGVEPPSTSNTRHSPRGATSSGCTTKAEEGADVAASGTTDAASEATTGGAVAQPAGASATSTEAGAAVTRCARGATSTPIAGSPESSASERRVIVRVSCGMETRSMRKRRLADVPDHDLIPATSHGESRGRGGERPTPKRQERATRKRPASTANLSEGAPASAGQRVRKAMDG